MTETKPVLLTLITAYVQGRMAETKHIWLTLISTYVQGRMTSTYFCILTIKNGCAQSRMINTDMRHAIVAIYTVSILMADSFVSKLIYKYIFLIFHLWTSEHSIKHI
jgi:integral membrane sensor domain MASE1